MPLAPTPIFATQRLLLHPLALDDSPAVQQIFPHWAVVRLLNARVPWPYPPDGVFTYYRDQALPAVPRGEEWHWTIRLRTAPHQPIGSIALFATPDNNRGFWIGTPWQRQGYLAEACDPVTDFWFNTLRQPVLRSPKAAANTASRRISEKQGMRLVRTCEMDFVSGHLPAELWEITAEEWNARPNP